MSPIALIERIKAVPRVRKAKRAHYRHSPA
jgi:hypothetical protein